MSDAVFLALIAAIQAGFLAWLGVSAHKAARTLKNGQTKNNGPVVTQDRSEKPNT